MRYSAPMDVADRLYMVNADVVVRRVGHETLLVPVSSRVGDLDSIYTLSEVGARIWSLLDRPRALEDIVSVLCAEYDVTAEVASQDAAEFLAGLAARKLVRPAPSQNVER